MHITLHPQRRDDALTVVKSGDTINLNGETFDFTDLPEGGVIEAEDIPTEWVCGSVKRQEGIIHINLILPHGPAPSKYVAFPEPILAVEDGPVKLPLDKSEKRTEL